MTVGRAESTEFRAANGSDLLGWGGMPLAALDSLGQEVGPIASVVGPVALVGSDNPKIVKVRQKLASVRHADAAFERPPARSGKTARKSPALRKRFSLRAFGKPPSTRGTLWKLLGSAHFPGVNGPFRRPLLGFCLAQSPDVCILERRSCKPGPWKKPSQSCAGTPRHGTE